MLFQDDVLKLFGSIFEEVYGPLSSGDSVNSKPVALGAMSVILPTCTTASVDVGHSAILDDSQPQHSELVAGHCAAAEIDSATNQLSSVGASDTQPAVISTSVSGELCELTHDISSRSSSDTARDWSAGTLLADCSGKAIEVIIMWSCYVFTGRELFCFFFALQGKPMH